MGSAHSPLAVETEAREVGRACRMGSVPLDCPALGLEVASVVEA
jgi:hypothetical protein